MHQFDRPPPGAGVPGFRPDPGQVPAEAAMGWLGTGWRYFAQAPLPWLGFLAVWFVGSMVAAAVPVIGAIAANVLATVLLAGAALAGESQRRGEELDFSRFFDGFQAPAFTPLLLLGLIYLVATVVVLVVMVVLMFVFFGGFALLGANAQTLDAAAVIPLFVVFMFAIVALVLPLGMATWLAPPLVAINGLEPVEAMKSSFQASLRNFFPLVLYAIVCVIVQLIAIVPLGLGLFVAWPVLLISSYAAYREIYYADR
jgi:uncharacterized membrane protein